jgi:hypothetical protein
MTTEPPEVLSPPSETPEWKPPPEFELIKELNGHAGRLATLLGLVVAALALSMSNGPIKDALTGFDLSAHAFVYGALLLAGLCIYSGAISVINALDPAAAVLHRGQRARELDDHEWAKACHRQTVLDNRGCRLHLGHLSWGLFLAWFFAYAHINLSWLNRSISDILGVVVLLIASSGSVIVFNLQAALREIRQTPYPEPPAFVVSRAFARALTGKGSPAPRAHALVRGFSARSRRWPCCGSVSRPPNELV